MNLHISISDADVERIKALATTKRLPLSSMGRVLIIERLDQIDEHTKSLRRG